MHLAYSFISNEAMVFFCGVQVVLVFWTILCAVQRFDQSAVLPLITSKELTFGVAPKLSGKSELYTSQVGASFIRSSWLFIILQTILCLLNPLRVLLSEVYEKYSAFSYFRSVQNKGGYNEVWSDFFRKFRISLFVVGLQLQLLERWPSQWHLVFAGYLAYQFGNLYYKLKGKHSWRVKCMKE